MGVGRLDPARVRPVLWLTPPAAGGGARSARLRAPCLQHVSRIRPQRSLDHVVAILLTVPALFAHVIISVRLPRRRYCLCRISTRPQLPSVRPDRTPPTHFICTFDTTFSDL